MKKYLLILALIAFNTTTFSQISDRLKDGLKFYTNSKDSSNWIKLNMCSQIQARYTENNPYTLVNGFSQGYTTDLAIRRIRFVLSGQLTDRIAFYMQFGQNSMTYLSARKAGAFFHDVTTDYALIKK